MPTSDQYLLIQNQGEAPVEGYTVLGYSSTRNCGVDGAIGQFGSGAKHAINLCLRNGLAVWVYCGTTRLEFSLEKEVIDDGLREDVVYHVIYRKDNASNFKRAGWVLDFGVLDWCDIGMGLREFVSNAIDRTIRETSLEEAKHNGDLSIKIVDDKDRRAKTGFTRVYVALNDEVREYYGNLGKRFLHFSDNPELAEPGLIKKETLGNSQIYREGVWVRELEGEAVFDYNFSANEIKIDECRNMSDFAVKAACAKRLRNAESHELAEVFKYQVDGKTVIESSFDEDYLTGFGCLNDTQRDRWKKAWEASAGPEAVVCDNKFSSDFVQKKGHAARTVGPNWAKALNKAGIRSANDILSIDEQRGRTRVETTPDAMKAVGWAWELFELANLVGGREKPEVFCFQEIGTAESKTNGYCNHEGVHFHVDIANDGQNNELRKVAVEELTHWITGAGDSTRDFQNFLMDCIVTLGA